MIPFHNKRRVSTAQSHSGLFGALGNGLLLTTSFNVYRSASPTIGRSANVHILIMQMAAGWLISGLGFLLDDSLVFGSILGHSPSLSVCLASYLTVVLSAWLVGASHRH
ncbi:hypothetical protein BV898_08788 [Hypsibius exemplaris]|uniref:Uncharacterized protein n=1 Tax=Hypsibius exemplaris TaxID=2072580 RepID=A0A1W0WPD8_HYPEX|nr:hypothetical protein BV898_08788 [Hypsibius exemplaris]